MIVQNCFVLNWQVMGFPIGGDYLSITEGVLSRIEASGGIGMFWPRMHQYNTWPEMLCGLCRGSSSFASMYVTTGLFASVFIFGEELVRATGKVYVISKCSVPQDPPISSSGD